LGLFLGGVFFCFFVLVLFWFFIFFFFFLGGGGLFFLGGGGVGGGVRPRATGAPTSRTSPTHPLNTPLQHIGATAGAITGVVTTPLDVLKTRLMTQGASGRYKGIVDCTTKIVQEEGVGTLFRVRGLRCREKRESGAGHTHTNTPLTLFLSLSGLGTARPVDRPRRLRLLLRPGAGQARVRAQSRGLAPTGGGLVPREKMRVFFFLRKSVATTRGRGMQNEREVRTTPHAPRLHAPRPLHSLKTSIPPGAQA